MRNSFIKELSSFRDPSGYIFYKDDIVYRSISYTYKDNYDMLMNSGLYKALVEKKLMIPHSEVQLDGFDDNCYKIIKPEQIQFISYPYEWCFSQLKDASLITLQIQKIALDFGMILKDASAYNIQFKDGRPIFIDTLSFDKYEEGKPWIAYRQFCQHFLAPLSLICYRDARFNEMLKSFIDGIPLDLTSQLLPSKTHFNSLALHIHLHSKGQKKYEAIYNNKNIEIQRNVPKFSLLAIIDSLETSIRKLKLSTKKTEWADYYENTNYTIRAMEHKKSIVSEYLDTTKSKTLVDMGSNTGDFSLISSKKGIQTISIDFDFLAIERIYQRCINDGINNILPLLININSPTPAIGWANEERKSFLSRCCVDTVLALAIIHHLTISNNIPFDKIAGMFSNMCNHLIIEFIPKSDTQIKKMLSTREDIFSNYTQQYFEKAFSNYFTIEKIDKIDESERFIYLMKNKTKSQKVL